MGTNEARNGRRQDDFPFAISLPAARVEQVGGGDDWPMVNGKLANFTKTNAYKWRDWYEESDYYTYNREREEEGDGGGAVSICSFAFFTNFSTSFSSSK